VGVVDAIIQVVEVGHVDEVVVHWHSHHEEYLTQFASLQSLQKLADY
jgi:hypothetical protein